MWRGLCVLLERLPRVSALGFGRGQLRTGLGIRLLTLGYLRGAKMLPLLAGDEISVGDWQMRAIWPMDEWCGISEQK